MSFNNIQQIASEIGRRNYLREKQKEREAQAREDKIERLRQAINAGVKKMWGKSDTA